MYSVFDSSVTIDANFSAVTVVYKGNHAALVLESVRPDDPTDKEIRFAHFLPIEIHSAGGSINSIIKTLEEFNAEARPAKVDLRMMWATERSDLIASLRITHTTSTYLVEDRIQMDNLVDRIGKEFSGKIKIPQFQLRGTYVNNGTAYNCRSWVREKLQIVGVEMSHNFIDHTSSDTLGSDDYAYCIIM